MSNNNRDIQGILKNVSFSPSLSVIPPEQERSYSSLSNSNNNWEYSNNNSNNYDSYVNYGTSSNWSSTSTDNNNNWDRYDYARVASPAHSRSASPAVSYRAQSPAPARSVSRSSSPAFSLYRSNQDSYDSGNQYYDSGAQQQSYASQIEQAMLNATNPININEREQITVNGVTGIYANKSEVMNWRGPMPIDQYQINSDANAQVVCNFFFILFCGLSLESFFICYWSIGNLRIYHSLFNYVKKLTFSWELKMLNLN